jgi:hypothetical protein
MKPRGAEKRDKTKVKKKGGKEGKNRKGERAIKNGVG